MTIFTHTHSHRHTQIVHIHRDRERVHWEIDRLFRSISVWVTFCAIVEKFSVDKEKTSKANDDQNETDFENVQWNVKKDGFRIELKQSKFLIFLYWATQKNARILDIRSIRLINSVATDHSKPTTTIREKKINNHLKNYVCSSSINFPLCGSKLCGLL